MDVLSQEFLFHPVKCIVRVHIELLTKDVNFNIVKRLLPSIADLHEMAVYPFELFLILDRDKGRFLASY